MGTSTHDADRSESGVGARPVGREILERVTNALRTRPARAIDPRPRPKGRPAAARRAAGTQPGVKPRDSGAPRRLVHPDGVPAGLLRPFRPPEIGGLPRTPGFTRGWAP